MKGSIGKYNNMKLAIILFNVAMVGILLSNCTNKKTSNTPELKNDADSVSYYTGIFAASTLKDLDAPKLNSDVFYKAVKEVFNQKEIKISKADADYNIGWYFDKLHQKQDEKNLKEGQAFLAKNKTRKGIITTSSGLQYEVIIKGTGTKLKDNDIVVSHQKGLFIDGREFLNSYRTGKPDTILFRKDNVLPGWYEALRLMNIGSKYRIYLPTELGFGRYTPPVIGLKPNMAVIFEIELLSIIPRNRINKK